MPNSRGVKRGDCPEAVVTCEVSHFQNKIALKFVVKPVLNGQQIMQIKFQII